MHTDERIPIAIVGLNFGRYIVEQLCAPRSKAPFRVTGLCDLDRRRAEVLAERFGALRIYGSLDEVLADPKTPVVGLFTGPVGRAELIGRIIAAGKDCMTTKPFESDPAAARTVLERAARLGRVVHLNSPPPGLGASVRTIAAWREAHGLGRPVAAHAAVWCSYREAADGTWYDDPARCPAAPLTRLGIYLLNELVPLLGRARRVGVLGSRLFTGRPTADNAQLAIEFESGALASVLASFCVRDGDAYRNSMMIHFENGTVYRDVGPDRAEPGHMELALVTSAEDGAGRRVRERRILPGHGGEYDWEGFARAVRREPDAPGYDIEHVVEPLRVLAAMAKAERTGEFVEVAR